MKKTILILAISLISFANYAQNGLKVKTSIATNIGMTTDVLVYFGHYCIDEYYNFSFSAKTVKNGGVIETFVIPSDYSYKLQGIPTIQIMWDSVANTLRAKGLIIEDL